MASFETGDFSQLLIDMRELANLPDRVQMDMLRVGGEILLKGQQETIKAMGINDTGETWKSLNIGDIKKGSSGKMSLYISPKGSRKRGNTTTRNAEILFINEFGKHGQPARPAVKTACEKYAGQVVDAEFKVYDDFLKSKNL